MNDEIYQTKNKERKAMPEYDIYVNETWGYVWECIPATKCNVVDPLLD